MYGIRSQCEELLNRVNGSKTEEIERLCPGECNLDEKNVCYNGKCKCLEFGGDDCSIDSSKSIFQNLFTK